MGTYTDVFGGGGEIRPLQEPGVCCICEATPDQAVTKIINTNRHFKQAPHVTTLAGRKYVCGDCAADLGIAIGQVNGVDHYDALSAIAEKEAQLAKAEETIASYAALDEAIKTLTAKPKTVKVKS